MNSTPVYPESNHKIAHRMAKIAIRSLYFEIRAYPKPGLVSFIDSGAHHDMDGETFYRSLFTLRHYFYLITRHGLENRTFAELRQTALNAECQMMKTTKGINTHRGAIFALGILCVSAARMSKEKTSFTQMELYEQLIKDWRNSLQKHRNNNGNGALVRSKYSVVDARQMAINGYEPIFELCSSFTTLFTKTQSLDHCCLFAYLVLLTKIDDTNVLFRKGMEGLNFAKMKAHELLDIECINRRQQEALKTHALFSREGISPGGVADLMSVLLFISQLFCEPLLCHY
ncbi:triphosphoribosyl-dephospho-CoA synthase [Legionella quateirensis]|uniref:triphosphoribosyl-dephospho-CoA synthase n=1 Tax=Legionella quateirensis TaxID=45072 RepID=A0A378KSE1_9GAMM|nr:triphosphoribosyl-dephospho-CoA synthase [Legionella quateirensis]KTD55338.1 2-(5''-triphosphoribosyl)-3'-dephosphocoenzyme-A synthase [Legionella quateirensis]STY16511.1 2-(5''-triphosphoribosyl)-3'-dephosphocoenzyme-A synthase [Legionella quateirensis]